VKRFSFSLERVRQWREKQVALEEAKLQRLFAELAAIQAARSDLDTEQRRNEDSVVSASGVTADELRALEEFRRFARGERQRLMQLEIDCGKRIAEQQQRITQARRAAQLLERLKEHRLRAWTAEFDREIEALAAEAYLAKWNTGQTE
jgi:flagellar biosynthesis chaperone FliJ